MIQNANGEKIMRFNFEMKKLDWSKLKMKINENSLQVWANGVTVVLLLLLAWTLGRAVWSFAFVSTPLIPVNSTASAPISNSPTSMYQLNRLINEHLFGQYQTQTAAAPVAPVVVNAPRTSLNLKLVGLVESSDPSLGVAIIAQGNRQQIYGIGEVIAGTLVSLRQVMNDHVILSNNGRNETLMLDGIDYNSRQSVPTTAARSETTNSSNNSNNAESQPVDRLSAIKSEIIKQPQALLKYITLAQHRNEQGQVVGYRVGPGQDSTFFDEVGLVPEDVATEINGLNLNDPASINRIWQALNETPEITMTVLRNGQPYNIYIPLN